MKSLKPLNENGYTIFEILSVVLIITILALIAIPNFVNLKGRGLDSHAEGNARTLQIMLETYRVDHKIYPEDLRTLGREASIKNYNKSLRNAYTNAQGIVETGKWAIDYVNPPGPKGVVGYQPLQNNSKYYIFVYQEDGELLKRNGKFFALTNG